MRLAHRIVLVLGFFGGLVMLIALGGFRAETQELRFALLPLALAAIVVYPTAWLFSWRR